MAMIQSHYEINVSKDGRHFFATAERSCVTHADMVYVLLSFKKKFPKKEGFEISVTYVECGGQHIDTTKIKEGK
jgi:hypothetical protein